MKGFVILAALLSFGCGSEVQPTDQSVALTVHVSDGAGVAESGAAVMALSATEARVRCQADPCVTDSTGRVELRVAPNATYGIQATKDRAGSASVVVHVGAAGQSVDIVLQRAEVSVADYQTLTFDHYGIAMWCQSGKPCRDLTGLFLAAALAMHAPNDISLALAVAPLNRVQELANDHKSHAVGVYVTDLPCGGGSVQ